MIFESHSTLMKCRVRKYDEMDQELTSSVFADEYSQ